MDAVLLELLACPTCKGHLSLHELGAGLCCVGCQVVYPVEDSIPILLPEAAISFEEWTKLQEKDATSPLSS